MLLTCLVGGSSGNLQWKILLSNRIDSGTFAYFWIKKAQKVYRL
jgi:hypothetical protein